MTARTPAGAPPRAARITILDILRALAPYNSDGHDGLVEFLSLIHI